MAKSVVIGLDLDGVVSGYIDWFRGYVAKEFGVDPSTLLGPSDYSFVKSGWPFTSEMHFKEVHGQAVESGMYADLQSFEGASSALWKLSDAGYFIRIITSRFVNHGQNAKVVTQTAEWLDRNSIPYRDLVFTSHKVEINADVYVDDSPSNIKAFQERGKDVLIYTSLYNKDLSGPRVDNWKDAAEYIESNYPLG